MAQFSIFALDPKSGATRKFRYDNMDSSLLDESGESVVSIIEKQVMRDKAPNPISITAPGRKISPKTLKISLGLSCNYECEYCSQRFVPRASETNPNDVEGFIAGLDAWVISPPEKIEFWGGEPLVYIKSLVPLAERLREKFPLTEFSIITNGSLLTKEINAWLDRMGFSVGLSHDGPGQSVRGPDPLDDPDKRASILDLYARLAPQGRMSFNTMMNRHNMSRAEVVAFFVALTKDPMVQIGEGGIVDAYDAGGFESSLKSDEFFKYRNTAFGEIRTGRASNFGVIRAKVASFVNSLRLKRPASALGQKCSMDREDNLAVDLKGNVLTCQNTSVAAMAPNGKSHKIGHVSELAKVELNTATHWSYRHECPSCPMLQICQGACMFLEGPLWETTCDNAYSDAVPVFAAGIEFLTGFVPVLIEGDFRQDRKDLFGGFSMSADSETVPRKPFPIPVVSA